MRLTASGVDKFAYGRAGNVARPIAILFDHGANTALHGPAFVGAKGRPGRTGLQ